MSAVLGLDDVAHCANYHESKQLQVVVLDDLQLFYLVKLYVVK